MQPIPFILVRWLIVPFLFNVTHPVKNPHDFTTAANHGNIGCVACHHPHQTGGKPTRWEPSIKSDQRFSLYSTSRTAIDRSSLMCLGCHDGAIADDIPAESAAVVVSQIGNSRANSECGIGNPLQSHPIGVPYPIAASQYVSKVTVEAKGFRLPHGRIECISCHDPHGTTGIPHLLVKSNRRSALCLSCHQL